MGLHASTPPAGARHGHVPHPFLFLILFMPFGAVQGFTNVALAYDLSKKGIDISGIAVLVALGYVAQLGKWIWAPLVDTFFTRKTWYIGSASLTGLGLWLGGAFATSGHISMWTLNAALALSNVACTFVGMSIESLMAASIPDAERGRASGWSQAGNLGGQGIAGGIGLWLIQGAGLSTAGSGAVVGAMCALCCLALLWIDDSKPLVRVDGHLEIAERLGLRANVRAIAGDLWIMLRSRIGILALLICVLPIGSGAAQNLWSPIADEWHASANVVALVNGALSGVISMAGCLFGGWACDRMDRKTGYCLSGLLLAITAIGMALCPHTSNQFIFWTSLYAFVIGLCYASYCAVVLEAVGRTSAATKFSFLSSLANAPLMYMTLVDGAANVRWGTNKMLWTEAWCGVAGLLVFMLVAGATRRRSIPAALAETA